MFARLVHSNWYAKQQCLHYLLTVMLLIKCIRLNTTQLFKRKHINFVGGQWNIVGAAYTLERTFRSYQGVG